MTFRISFISVLLLLSINVFANNNIARESVLDSLTIKKQGSNKEIKIYSGDEIKIWDNVSEKKACSKNYKTIL